MPTENPARARSLVAGVVALMSGSTLAQLVALVAAPLLTRVYPPAAFGALSLFTAVGGVLLSVAMLRYETGVVLPDDDRDAGALLAAAAGMNVVSAVLACALGLLLHDVIGSRVDAGSAGAWSGLFGLLILVSGWIQLGSYWATRRSAYGSVARVRLVQALGVFGMQLWLGFRQARGVELATGQVAGLCLAVLVLWFAVVRADFPLISAAAERQRIRKVLREHAGLARYAVQSAFANSASTALLPIVLTNWFGLTLAGVLMLAERLVTQPIDWATQSIWQVLHSQLPRRTEAERVAMIARTHRLVTVLFVLPLSALAAFAQLTPLIFGAAWVSLPTLILPLAMLAWFRGVSNATSYFAVFGAYRLQARFDATLIIGRCASVVLGAASANEMGAIHAYVWFSAAFYLAVNTFWGRRLGLSRPFLANMVSAIAIGCIPVVAGSVLDVTSKAGFAAVALACAAAGVLCIRASGMTIDKLRQLAAAR